MRVRFHRPDGRPIPAVPEPPPLPADPVGEMVRVHRTQGVEPDAWTATPIWNGEAFDYGLALDMLRGPGAQARRARGSGGDTGWVHGDEVPG